MKHLKESISSEYMGFQSWDGRNNIIGNPNPKTVCRCNVCSVDPDYKGSHYDILQNFIKTEYDSRKQILLASGQNPTDLRNAMSLKQCKGIGEVFVWKTDDGWSNPVSNLGLLDVVRGDTRPIYIHWDMSKSGEWERFEKFLSEYQGPVILCHLGVNKMFKNQRQTIQKFGKLQKTYKNLWGEISWDALDWLSKYPDNIKYLDSERIFTASDMTGLDNSDKRGLQMASLLGLVKSTRNIKNLFNIK